jgi:hypothetical protein
VGNAILKLAWVAVVAATVWVMSGALWDVDYFEPTEKAIHAERDGMRVLLLTCLVLLAAAVFAYLLLLAPLWAAVLVGLAGLLCYGLALTPITAVLAIFGAYPCALAGVVGCTLSPRRVTPSSR